jgi:hypothetical protein
MNIPELNISIYQYRAFNNPTPTPAPAPSSRSQSNLISPHATRGPALPVVRDCQVCLVSKYICQGFVQISHHDVIILIYRMNCRMNCEMIFL